MGRSQYSFEFLIEEAQIIRIALPLVNTHAKIFLAFMPSNRQANYLNWKLNIF